MMRSNVLRLRNLYRIGSRHDPLERIRALSYGVVHGSGNGV